jgi:hypothetical protein
MAKISLTGEFVHGINKVGGATQVVVARALASSQALPFRPPVEAS